MKNLLITTLLLTACINAPPFQCTSDAQCTPSPPGLCVQYTGLTGYCAFPDETCTSKYRYHNSAIPDLIGKCASIPKFEVTSVRSGVGEHEVFSVHLVVRDENGAKLESYHGVPTLMATWGDVRTFSTPNFAAGEADVNVWLNRPSNDVDGPAAIIATDGAIQGRSSGIKVNPYPFQAEETTLLPSAAFDTYRLNSKFSAIERAGNTIMALTFTGPTADKDGIYLASASFADKLYTPGTNPILRRTDTPWIDSGISSPSLAASGSKLFLSYQAQIDDFSFAWGVVGSTDGTSWAQLSTGAITNPSLEGDCGFLIQPKLVAVNDSKLQLFFTGKGKGATAAQCMRESQDGGHSWSPATKLIFNGAPMNFIALQLEGSVYKGWDDRGSYATSSDGINWIVAETGAFSGWATVFWHEGNRRYYALSKVASAQTADKNILVYSRP